MQNCGLLERKYQPNSTESKRKLQELQFEISSSPQPEAIVKIEPADYWDNRWLIQIEDCNLTWKLVPCLRRAEAEAILTTLQLLEVDLWLAQNEGRPIAVDQINRITDLYLDSPMPAGGEV